jgi:EAL domain-containing protein (putative c-di-GMP-specific phosphodiesterase class I)
MSVLFRRESPGMPDPEPSGARPVGSQKNAARQVEITKIVSQRLVTVEFQPIVRIATGETVAFESFARGPIGSALATPDAMFQAAGAAGLTGELDLVAANAAYMAARFSPHPESLTIFVNTDPAGLLQLRATDSEEIRGLQQAVHQAMVDFRAVVEIPEHTLARDPLPTIIAAESMRRIGARLAIDNVGVAPQALPLIMFMRPDVVKLAPSVLASPPHARAPVLDAVATYTEQSGSVVVAQGIETDDHLQAAIGMGAVLGQGYHFGHPMTVPVAAVPPAQPLAVRAARPAPDPATTPYALLAGDHTPVRMDHGMFCSLAGYLMDGAEAATEPFVMVVVTSNSSFLSGGRASRLRSLGHKASLLLVLSTNTELVSTRDTAVGVLDAQDPLREELVLATMSLTASSMLVARPVEDERYDCMITHDRALVQSAMDNLLGRVVTAPPG